MKTKTISFISTFSMYEKERSGKKPNTLRKLKNNSRLKGVTHVRIRKGYTKVFFTRKITDITFWYGLVIISWNPNEIVISKQKE